MDERGVVEKMGVRNTLGDLNNHLFEQLERLNDDDLTGEELKQEIQRSNAISNVAKQIIGNANTVLNAQKLYLDAEDNDINKPRKLEG